MGGHQAIAVVGEKLMIYEQAECYVWALFAPPIYPASYPLSKLFQISLVQMFGFESPSLYEY